MIVTSSQRKVDLEERLQSKTVEQMFLTSVEEGANCPPFVARAILDVAKSTFNVGNGAEHEVQKTRPGQMKVLGICASEPAGKPLKECRLSDAVLTLDAGVEDQVIRLTGAKSGVTDLRRKRLLRISSEALEQGVLLTREDIAYRILNCGTRTVTRDVKYFERLGIQVPFGDTVKTLVLPSRTRHRLWSISSKGCSLLRFPEEPIIPWRRWSDIFFTLPKWATYHFIMRRSSQPQTSPLLWESPKGW